MLKNIEKLAQNGGPCVHYVSENSKLKTSGNDGNENLKI